MMVIRKKPTNLQPETTIPESMINAVIEAGGSLSKKGINSDKPYRLTFRIPHSLKIQVDGIIASDPAEPSLTAWILEAIKQRLQNEN